MLKKGDKIPSLSLLDQNGDQVTLHASMAKPVVIFFYPKDETPGCVAEVCSFRDSYEDFMEIGAEVIGISSDSVTSHARFTKKRSLPFKLLSDVKREAEKKFGVKRNFLGLLPGRVTFIFDATGILIHSFSSQTNPTQHTAEALKALKA